MPAAGEFHPIAHPACPFGPNHLTDQPINGNGKQDLRATFTTGLSLLSFNGSVPAQSSYYGLGSDAAPLHLGVVPAVDGQAIRLAAQLVVRGPASCRQARSKCLRAVSAWLQSSSAASSTSQTCAKPLRGSVKVLDYAVGELLKQMADPDYQPVSRRFPGQLVVGASTRRQRP